MKKIIKNNYKLLLGVVLGFVLFISGVYAIDIYLESKKVTYDNKQSNGKSYNHSSWYGDLAYFVSSSNPWFGRGGFHNYGVLAGQFFFDISLGEANGGIGFRLVLAPSK